MTESRTARREGNKAAGRLQSSNDPLGTPARLHQPTEAEGILGQAIKLLQLITLTVLLAFTARSSQQTLSPVYGAIPSGVWHSRLIQALFVLGWNASSRISDGVRQLTGGNSPKLLPVIALYIPAVQFFLSKFSEAFGPVWGPVVTETCTLGPLVLLTISCVVKGLEDIDLVVFSYHVPSYLVLMSFFLIHGFIEHSPSSTFALLDGFGFSQRILSEFNLSVTYSLLFPSSLQLLAMPALLHTWFFNYHFMTGFENSGMTVPATLNAVLATSGWALLHRAESNTGYISVLDNQRDGFRVLRCDHSLLGGEWLHAPPGLKPEEVKVKEPIYAIFAMLEAVRLVEVPEVKADADSTALVIGMGIGTTPSALIAHGIETTVVEIDPILFDLAENYFSFPEEASYTKVPRDAIQYAAELANGGSPIKQFDYLIHEYGIPFWAYMNKNKTDVNSVFTGGAEPIELFTFEFLSNLNTILKPNGVIAINYAGDLLLPPSRLVVRTILSIFPTCRIFREMEAPPPEVLSVQGQDFTNMVIFCLKADEVPSQSEKSKPAKKLRFRRPVEADFLNSAARQRYLVPTHEIQAKQFQKEVTTKREGWSRLVSGQDEVEPDILLRNETQAMEKYQERSAVGHWRVMRTVIPGNIWEAW